MPEGDMMIELPAGIWNLTPLGALVGVLVLLVWWVSTDRFIPGKAHRRQIDELRQSHAIVLAAEKKRGDEWKETAMESRAANAELRSQNTTLLEAVRTSSHFFKAVTPADVPEDTQPGGTYVAP